MQTRLYLIFPLGPYGVPAQARCPLAVGAPHRLCTAFCCSGSSRSQSHPRHLLLSSGPLSLLWFGGAAVTHWPFISLQWGITQSRCRHVSEGLEISWGRGASVIVLCGFEKLTKILPSLRSQADLTVSPVGHPPQHTHTHTWDPLALRKATVCVLKLGACRVELHLQC